MKVCYMSDLHLEFLTENEIDALAIQVAENSNNAEILSLGGDITNFDNIPKLIRFLSTVSDSYLTVLYVLGNHEFYSIEYIEDFLKIPSIYEAELSIFRNLFVLDSEVIEINGKTIAGSTLWFNINHPVVMMNPKLTNDVEHIPGGLELIGAKFDEATDFIVDLCESDSAVDLFISHYGITPKVNPKFEGDLANVFFYRDLTPYLHLLNVERFIFGHQHSNHEYYVSTKAGVALVDSNCKGYRPERFNFDVNKVVTI